MRQRINHVCELCKSRFGTVVIFTAQLNLKDGIKPVVLPPGEETLPRRWAHPDCMHTVFIKTIPIKRKVVIRETKAKTAEADQGRAARAGILRETPRPVHNVTKRKAVREALVPAGRTRKKRSSSDGHV